MATYGIVLFYPASPSASELMLSHALAQPVEFTAGFPSSQAQAKTAATAETIFSIQHVIPPNAPVEVGTVTFAAAGTVGTYAATADFTVDTAEVFDIVAPATPDATLADITFTIVGTTTGSGPKPVNLSGTVKCRTICIGQLTFTPTLVGRVSAGPLEANGRLRVTHDFAIFSNG